MCHAPRRRFGPGTEELPWSSSLKRGRSFYANSFGVGGAGGGKRGDGIDEGDEESLLHSKGAGAPNSDGRVHACMCTASGAI